MLELKNVSLTVEDGSEILKNVNLKVDDGKFVVITGPNGGGKSTLARVIAGVRQPTSGKIFLDDLDISHKSITERAKAGISFAFQQPVRFKGLTVHDLLNLASTDGFISKSEACKYLSSVGMCAKDYIDRELNDSLSGGEIKRIEIASVLIRETKLSIFDEPEAGIDLWSFSNLIDVFNNMYKKIKGSIIIISHQERILNIADEIVVMSKGEIINQGPKDAILPSLLANSVPTSPNKTCPKQEVHL